MTDETKYKDFKMKSIRKKPITEKSLIEDIKQIIQDPSLGELLREYAIQIQSNKLSDILFQIEDYQHHGIWILRKRVRTLKLLFFKDLKIKVN